MRRWLDPKKTTTIVIAALALALLLSLSLHFRAGSTRARMTARTAQREAALESELDRLTVDMDRMRQELSYLKDSLISSVLARRLSPALSREQQTALTFDSRFPSSFDNGAKHIRSVALTFDADAHSNAAQDILDTLGSRGVTVTMFFTGQFMERNPELLRRVLARGHEIGNHMWSHPRLTAWATDRTHATLPGVTRATIFSELGRTERMFEKITGQQILPLWRAPYGERNRAICAWAQEAGFLHVGWRQGRTWRENLDSNDWIVAPGDPGYFSPEEVLEKILAAAKKGPDGVNGGIILFHLGSLRKQRSQQVHLKLGVLIDNLRELGYSFVTVSDMAAQSGIDLSALRKPL